MLWSKKISISEHGEGSRGDTVKDDRESVDVSNDGKVEEREKTSDSSFDHVQFKFAARPPKSIC